MEQLLQTGISTEKAKNIVSQRNFIDLKIEEELLIKNEINLVVIDDENYPELLKTLSDAPPILFYKGKLPKKGHTLISVVGSRKATTYGLEATKKITKGLISQKIGIVSGLAFGIDTQAHRATIDSNGYTIAVLANGLDDIYPAQNKNLAQEIIDCNGCLISELPPKIPMSKGLFLRRNRIIAGLSKATLVVEATEKSGSLITARQAMEYNRDVLAVPGSIFSMSSMGTNKLIQQGAKLVQTVEDVVESLELLYTSINPSKIEVIYTDTEQRIIDFFEGEPLHINTLVEKSSLSTKESTTLIGLMELKGLIHDIGGKWYIPKR